MYFFIGRSRLKGGQAFRFNLSSLVPRNYSISAAILNAVCGQNKNQFLYKLINAAIFRNWPFMVIFAA